MKYVPGTDWFVDFGFLHGGSLKHMGRSDGFDVCSSSVKYLAPHTSEALKEIQAIVTFLSFCTH